MNSYDSKITYIEQADRVKYLKDHPNHMKNVQKTPIQEIKEETVQKKE